MLTGTYDTDNIMFSYLDVSTIAYIKNINKYYYKWISKMPNIVCSNIYPLTKSLLETNNFLETNEKNIIFHDARHLLKSTDQCDIISSRTAMLLRIYAKFCFETDIIKKYYYDNNCKPCDKIFKYISGYGTTHDLEWLKTNNFSVDQLCCINAIENFKNDNLIWLHNNYPSDNNLHLKYESCIKCNNIEALQFLIKNSNQKDSLPITYAAMYGNLEAFNILLNNNFPIMYDIYESIAKNGNIDIFNKILNILNDANTNENIHYKNISMATAFAAERGDTNMITTLINNNFPKHKLTIAHGIVYCAKNNDTSLLEWLLKIGFEKNSDAYVSAVECDNIFILEWLLKNEFPRSLGIFWRAIEMSNINILEWLITNKFPIDSYTLSQALSLKKTRYEYILDALVQKQDLRLLEFIKKNNIYGSEYILYYLPRIYINKYPNEKIIQIIKWLIINGYESSNTLFYFGICIENIELLDLMIQYKVPYDSNIILYLLKNDRINIVKYLINKKMNYDSEVLNYIVKLQKKDLLTIAYKNNKQMADEMYICAIKNNNFEIIKYMIDNNFKINNKNVFSYAIKNCNVEIINLLATNNFPCYKKDNIKYLKIVDWILLNK